MYSSWCWRLLTVIGFILTTSATTVDDNIITSTDAHQLTDGPIISPPQNEVILQKGQNYTIFCKGKSKLQFKQQDIPEEVVGNFYMEQRDVPTLDLEYKHEIALDLYNVDQFAIGYYACFDSTVNSSDVLNYIVEEPVNTGHISYIYIYVNGSDSMFAPMREVVIARGGTKFVIECRPTSPDIKVSLTVPQSNKTPDYKYSPKIGFILENIRKSAYKCIGVRENQTTWKTVSYRAIPPPKPQVIGGLKSFLEGETFSLSCSVGYQKNSAVMLSWNLPPLLNKEFVTNETNEHAVTDGKLYYNITISNATRNAKGNYTCISKNGYGQKEVKLEKTFLDKAFINLSKGNKENPLETSQTFIRLIVHVQAYPEVTFTFYRNNVELPIKDTKFTTKLKYIINRTADGSATLTIKDLDVYDTANYTMIAKNEYLTENITFDLRVKSPPIINFGPSDDRKYVENTIVTLVCEAVGYPLPNIQWIFSSDDEQTLVNDKTIVESIYKVKSFLEIPVRTSGDITCLASNAVDNSSETRKFLVWEIPGGFGIKNEDQTWFYENQNVTIECLASKYDFINVTWLGQSYEENYEGMELNKLVEYTENPFSLVTKLKIDHISLNQTGNYSCYGLRNDESGESRTVAISVEASRLLVINDPKVDKNEEVYPFQSVYLTCQADAVPPPQIEWYKDDKKLSNDSNTFIYKEYLDHTILNSTVEIRKMQMNATGKYDCVAISNANEKRRTYNVNLNQNEKSTFKATYLSIIGVIIFILIILVVYLTWKIRKEKQFRKELAAAGLLYFKEGVTKSLNPDLGIDEQAELLPYDDKFEFPPEKLTLGKQLGAGAFGVVYKAEARGIINAEESTTVAVKMVKKTADNMYIKALASELKIMVHLGKHINIVNLLGACTKNVGKRELIVIVEYCKFGNIHNYMQKHRQVFIDQLTDNTEKTLGKVNRGFSCSSGNSGMQSDYFGSNHTQDTDHTFLNTANTNRSGRKVSETGYVQPEWRSNYESDYSYDGHTPRPLCSRDLLCWAFQIARGMEYLASRKVLHGDLAARNILLAEDNIVKICDFGLARSIYKNDEYQKKENSPLPVKWLAIECMTDRIFSTQSDVWSFGIVLWELFSLAKTPYPNISPPSLLQWLSDGHRLEKPPHADDRLYDVMLRCWEQKPTSRPSFSQLQETLGSFLEDNVRNHYVDLNSAYMDMNIKREGQEDYLAMVCAPDYKNLVTPSPHHYVNDVRSFFPPTPTQLQHDDEGYLQMSPATNPTIFSPRAQGTKFDFDARKLNPRVSEANSHGSELTPMLTLNNLPARSGSESDHEGNASPYLNMCPRIEEEADEVFETKQNNIRNIQNCAVTNPTYITFDVDLEKKPKDITNTNNYVNVSTPNGLVK